jgi:uncharacterized protein
VPAIFIAGGIGISLMMGMLRWCVKEQPGHALHLYYSLRNRHGHARMDGLMVYVGRFQ